MDVIITTIYPPNAATTLLSKQLSHIGGRLWVVGDLPGPVSYDLPNAVFIPIVKQESCDFELANKLPKRHYSRKNLGYLFAIQASQPSFIVETDDDNIPKESFLEARQLELESDVIDGDKWANVYQLFSDESIWPRGLPLDEIHASGSSIQTRRLKAYIQQGLSDANPDVDAVFRLTRRLPVFFKDRAPVALNENVWCPFNSQATTFFRDAFPLLYLPSYCSFRMTDIWRSFVAQRCVWEMGGNLIFTKAITRQERNVHNLLKDFEDEIPGYLQNKRLVDLLAATPLVSGVAFETVSCNLLKCYEVLCENDIIGRQELTLVNAWVQDLERIL